MKSLILVAVIMFSNFAFAAEIGLTTSKAGDLISIREYSKAKNKKLYTKLEWKLISDIIIPDKKSLTMTTYDETGEVDVVWSMAVANAKMMIKVLNIYLSEKTMTAQEIFKSLDEKKDNKTHK